MYQERSLILYVLDILFVYHVLTKRSSKIFETNKLTVVHESNENDTTREIFEAQFDVIPNELENEPYSFIDFSLKGKDNKAVVPKSNLDRTNNREYSLNIPRTGASHKKCVSRESLESFFQAFRYFGKKQSLFSRFFEVSNIR